MTRRAVRGRHRTVAAEAGGHYLAEIAAGTDDALDALGTAVDGLTARPVDELDDGTLSRELKGVQRACRKLEARQARLAAARSARESRRAREAARAAGRAEDASGQHATRRVRRELRDELGWSPVEAKRAVELGRQLDPSRTAGRAFDAGDLPPRHAAVLSDTLRWIETHERRREAEQRLVKLAAEQDPVTFGRTCRRLLAEFDPAGAEHAARRRRGRRTGSVWATEDGMAGVSGRLAGVDAELFTTAFHAFRRPDAPGEHRRPEQAGADALVAMARAALDAGSAPSHHGVRPHVTVWLDWQAIAADGGKAEGPWTGPLPVDEVRRLLADCGVSRLLLDPDGVALEAGEAVRTVPAGLARAVTLRDGGCIADGCDMPPSRCQMMHLDVPYRLDGRLKVGTAALGCPHHHDAFDRRGWKITWIEGRPVLHHPDRPPRPKSATSQPAISQSGASEGAASQSAASESTAARASGRAHPAAGSDATKRRHRGSRGGSGGDQADRRSGADPPCGAGDAGPGPDAPSDAASREPPDDGWLGRHPSEPTNEQQTLGLLDDEP